MNFRASFIQMVTTLLTLRRPLTEMRGKDTQVDSALRYLNSNIKSAADPCTNFQEYACGYFGINTLYDVVLGNKNTNTSTHSERYAEIDRILLEMLNRDDPESQAVEKAKVVFHKCRNHVEVNHDTDVTLLKELKRVGFGETLSPQLLMNDDFINDFDYMAAWASLLKHPTLFSNFLMFRIDVVEDSERRGRYVPLIQMSPEDPNELQSEERTAVNYIYQYFRPIDTTPDRQAERQLAQINAEREALWYRIRQITSESDSIFVPEESKRYFTRTNLKELQDKTNKWMAEMESSEKYPDLTYNKSFKIVWTKFFDKLFADVRNDGVLTKKDQLITTTDFIIYVSDIKKLENIVKLLAKTRTKTFVLTLWLATVINTIPLGYGPLRTDYLENAETTPKILSLNNEQLCLAIVKDTFRLVVAHELLQDVTTDDKLAVKQLLIDTRKTFVEIINEVEWLSDDAKIFITGRIKGLQIHFPYIETQKNPGLLEDVYEEMTHMGEMSAYDCYTEILRIKRRTEFSRIFEKPQSTRLQIRPPIDVFSNDEVVKYNPDKTALELSLALFGHPYYYGSSYPLQSLNLGAIGFHAVRQMVHVLDDTFDRILQHKPTHILQVEEESRLRKKMISATMMIRRSENEESKNDMKRTRNARIEAIADNISLNVCFRTLLNNHSNSISKTLTGENAGFFGKLTRNCKDTTPRQFFTTMLAMTMCKKSPLPSTTYVNYGQRINELFRHWGNFQLVRHCANECDMMKLDKHESRAFVFSKQYQ